MKCCHCFKWRQIPIQSSCKRGVTKNKFICSSIARGVSCDYPEDRRVAAVPQNFIQNNFTPRFPGLLLKSPLTFLCFKYPPLLLGIAPPELLTDEDSDQSCESSKRFVEFRQPFSEPRDEHNLPGIWNPISCFRWETTTYPNLMQYGHLYQAVRNTIVYLWNSGKFDMIIAEEVAKFIFIRGLIRIIIVDEWLPNFISHFTDRCLINVGRCIEPKQTGEKIDRRYVIVAPIDLKSTTVYRQIINSLEVRSMNERSSVLYSTLSNLPHTPEFTSSIFTEQLMVPISIFDFPISNHVVSPINNYAMIFAKQMNLPTKPQGLPVLFQRGVDGTVRIYPDHLEQSRSLVDRLFYSTVKMNQLNESPESNSIQGLLDARLAALILELDTPMELPVDLRLIEYCYACIEERLTVLILSSEVKASPTTPCLDDLSPLDFCRYLQSRGPGFYHYVLKILSNHYAPQEFIEPGAFSSITKGLGPNKEVGNAVRSIIATPSLYTLDDNDSELHKTELVVVTIPTSRMKIIFCDSPTEEALKSLQEGQNSDKLQIFLPHNFRVSMPTMFELENPTPVCSPSSNIPVYMTVTLMYEEPWWRQLLYMAGTWEKMNMCYQSIDLDEVPFEFSEAPKFFAFVPKSRKDRGFCHYFKDISPPDSSCGIIQTCIIGSNLCNDWAKNDIECANLVDKQLKHTLATNARRTGILLEYYVKRLYAPTSVNDANSAPEVEVKSANPDLLDKTRAVGVNVDCSDDVHLTDSKFVINGEWWRMLSEQASIHVLLELTTVCGLTKPIQNELFALDILSREVLTGLKWSKYVLGELMSSETSQEGFLSADSVCEELIAFEENEEPENGASDAAEIETPQKRSLSPLLEVEVASKRSLVD
nr:lysine specific histone demethylase 1B [Hymenolepis microstoma]